MSSLAAVSEAAPGSELHLVAALPESSPSPRAIAWAWEVILGHGQPGNDGLVIVPLTQRQLAVAAHCSPGTISWYLRSLGPAVRRDGGGVIFDRRALSQIEEEVSPPSAITARCASVADQLLDIFGRPGADGRIDLVVDDQGRRRPASLTDMASELGLARSSIHRHLTALERSGRFGHHGRQHFAHHGGASPLSPRLVGIEDEPEPPVDHDQMASSVDQQSLAVLGSITKLLGDVARLVETIAAPARPRAEQPARDVGAQVPLPSDLRASPVASRPPGSSPFDLKDEISSVQSTTRDSKTNGLIALRGNQSRPERDWSDDQLPELLAPLLAECQRLTLPGVTDATRVIECLRPYSAAQVTAAARHLAASLTGGAPMRSPVAVLVSKARDGDPYCFPPVRSERQAGATPPPMVQVVEVPCSASEFAADIDRAVDDDAAVQAVAQLDAAELSVLDALVQERLATLPASARRMTSTAGLGLWRRIVWRERQGNGAI